MADHVVHLQSKRFERAKLAQKLQHVVAGLALVGDGLSVLNAGPGGFALGIAVAEVVGGAAFLVMVARAARVVFKAGARGGHAAPAHRGVNWIDVVAAAMLLVEAVAHWHATGHIRRPTVLTAVILLVLAFAHGRIEAATHRRRALRVTDDGVSIGGRKLWNRRLTLAWNQVARIDVSNKQARIVATDGRERRIDLLDLHNAPDVVRAFDTARDRITALGKIRS